LEAVVDSRLYFWHAFFGCPGAQNDINVLDCSTLFTSLLEGTAPQVRYVVNDRMYKMGYYLADDIYPEWHILMKTISSPQTPKQTHFAKRQESRRKDVERGFGGVQCRFQITSMPCKLMYTDTMEKIIIAAIILHNMIIVDKQDFPELNQKY